jgi:methionine biosynthesis protein MetW
MEMSKPQRRAAPLRLDLQIIADMIAPSTRVLDVGCGDGELLAYLKRAKGVDGRGIELSQAGVNACVGHGLSVIQGDADTDLRDYPRHSFDYAVLSQTLPATSDPKGVLLDLARIGRHAIVSIANFGYWRLRLSLLMGGHVPITDDVAQHWYDTPNIHPCTIADFLGLAHELGVRIERSVSINRRGRTRQSGTPRALANLLDEQAIFLLRKD